MKRIYIEVVIIMLLLTTLLNCSAKQEFDVKFDNENYDFGTVDEGTEVKFEYVFKNTGKQTLIIDNVRPACGCTAAEDWDKEVAPGATGRIPITFRTDGYNGEVSKSVSITTNIPEKENMILTMKGIVANPVSITPRSVYLGDVGETTGPVNGSFMIENHSAKPLNILEILAPNEQITYTLEVLEEGQKFRLDFTLTPPYIGEEVMRDRFVVKTDNTQQPYYYAQFSYFVSPPIQVYPMKIMINMDDANNSIIERRINIRKHIDQPIAIENVKLFGAEGIEYSVKEVNPESVFQIAVRIPPTFKFPENADIYLTFKVTNDPRKLEYKISLEEYTVPIN